MNKIDKTSRASQTRSKSERPKVWRPGNALEAPKAKSGYRHRWLRAETMGIDDSKNIASKILSGYELGRADEYPSEDFSVIDSGKYQGVIGVQGLVLARIPEELAKQRDEYYENLTQDKDKAVEQDAMKDQDPRVGPINVNRQSRVTFGGTKNN